MLVLSRKENQAIIIGDEVKITVVNIHGDHVKLGINAPKSIKVYREEVYEEIQAENIRAAQVSLENVKNLKDIFKKNK